ncbi:hypothetical protein H0H93_014258 [Arthromyces matolae]|nr:hypothetical protein H0H93_014258 [Arthromyces matolae]
MRLKFTIILPLTCLFLASAINSLPIKNASSSTNSLVLPVRANPAAPGNRKNSPLRSVTLPPASDKTETLIPTPKAKRKNRKANPIGSWAKKVFHRLKPQAGSTTILPDRPLEEYPLKTLNKRIETLMGELEAERKSPFGNLYTEEEWVKKILELFDAEKRKLYLETKAPPTPTFQRHLGETVDLIKAAMKSTSFLPVTAPWPGFRINRDPS